jgi:aarF domain-containing kinase
MHMMPTFLVPLAAAAAAVVQVTLKSTVSTVVVTTLVLEGWSRELDPDLHIMDALRDMLAVDWKGRLSSAVDKVRCSCVCLGGGVLVRRQGKGVLLVGHAGGLMLRLFDQCM